MYLVPGAGGSTGWADAATIIPWNMYLAYGDKKILENQYSSMKAWVELYGEQQYKLFMEYRVSILATGFFTAHLMIMTEDQPLPINI